ncbi:MAG TPA: MFS transporter [Thermomicrobiales bacterium]|nr:MFS transporter [Thermomicrobiales bacterium]
MFTKFFRNRQRSALWRNHDFLNLWSAETIAQFGSQLSLVAVPLIAALTLDASPLEMGILAASGSAAGLILGFIAGVWVDRLPRKPIMIAMDVGRALTFAAIPIAALMDILTFQLLLVVAILGGCQTVFFNAAWSAIIPNLVDRKHLSDANGKLFASLSLAQVIGPALAGSLIGWFSGPMVMGITSGTFAWSGWFLTRIRHPEPPRNRSTPGSRPVLREIREGLDELLGSKLVRPLTTSAAVLNFGGFIFLAVYVLYLTDDLGLSTSGVGLVFAAGGIGSLVGSIVAPTLARTFGVGRTVLWSATIFGVGNMLVPLAILVPAYALPLIVASETIAWMSLIVFNINRFSLRQALTPDHLQGRVSSSTIAIISGVQMLGSLMGGVIGQVFSVHTALIVGTVGMLVAAWWIWDSPIPGIRDMPEHPEEVFVEAGTVAA